MTMTKMITVSKVSLKKDDSNYLDIQYSLLIVYSLRLWWTPLQILPDNSWAFGFRLALEDLFQT